MDYKLDFAIMKDKLIDDGCYDKVDDCIDVMLRRAYQAGFSAGKRETVAMLAAKGLLHITIQDKKIAPPETEQEHRIVPFPQSDFEKKPDETEETKSDAS